MMAVMMMKAHVLEVSMNFRNSLTAHLKLMMTTTMMYHPACYDEMADGSNDVYDAVIVVVVVEFENAALIVLFPPA